MPEESLSRRIYDSQIWPVGQDRAKCQKLFSYSGAISFSIFYSTAISYFDWFPYFSVCPLTTSFYILQPRNTVHFLSQGPYGYSLISDQFCVIQSTGSPSQQFCLVTWWDLQLTFVIFLPPSFYSSSLRASLFLAGASRTFRENNSALPLQELKDSGLRDWDALFREFATLRRDTRKSFTPEEQRRQQAGQMVQAMTQLLCSLLSASLPSKVSFIPVHPEAWWPWMTFDSVSPTFSSKSHFYPKLAGQKLIRNSNTFYLISTLSQLSVPLWLLTFFYVAVYIYRDRYRHICRWRRRCNFGHK